MVLILDLLEYQTTIVENWKKSKPNFFGCFHLCIGILQYSDFWFIEQLEKSQQTTLEDKEKIHSLEGKTIATVVVLENKQTWQTETLLLWPW